LRRTNDQTKPCLAAEKSHVVVIAADGPGWGARKITAAKAGVRSEPLNRWEWSIQPQSTQSQPKAGKAIEAGHQEDFWKGLIQHHGLAKNLNLALFSLTSTTSAFGHPMELEADCSCILESSPSASPLVKRWQSVNNFKQLRDFKDQTQQSQGLLYASSTSIAAMRYSRKNDISFSAQFTFLNNLAISDR